MKVDAFGVTKNYFIKSYPHLNNGNFTDLTSNEKFEYPTLEGEKAIFYVYFTLPDIYKTIKI